MSLADLVEKQGFKVPFADWRDSIDATVNETTRESRCMATMQMSLEKEEIAQQAMQATQPSSCAASDAASQAADIQVQTGLSSFPRRIPSTKGGIASSTHTWRPQVGVAQPAFRRVHHIFSLPDGERLPGQTNPRSAPTTMSAESMSTGHSSALSDGSCALAQFSFPG
eukprot:TRINITY_DN22969_c0_g1_i3.p1 TRINITY_DN22969_c0_g1~~TRINITY_DN22969_c0_g1_i3.p1  ORF type:complete len:168 (-),score=23.88 TRINITY_DN22969_c0_g1_i3:435-938(-)